jgi:FMN reductase
MTLTVVGIGGSLRVGSQTEFALRVALDGAREAGASVVSFTGHDLVLPFYDPMISDRPESAYRMIDAIRAADGVVLVSPGYHSTVSGLVKNALDYVEDLRGDTRPYLEDRAVGCVATALGWQAAVTTLTALRSVVHALRGWPTPLGAALNTAEVRFLPDGSCTDAKVEAVLRAIGRQVVEFARSRSAPSRRALPVGD